MTQTKWHQDIIPPCRHWNVQHSLAISLGQLYWLHYCCEIGFSHAACLVSLLYFLIYLCCFSLLSTPCLSTFCLCGLIPSLLPILLFYFYTLIFNLVRHVSICLFYNDLSLVTLTCQLFCNFFPSVLTCLTVLTVKTWLFHLENWKFDFISFCIALFLFHSLQFYWGCWFYSSML